MASSYRKSDTQEFLEIVTTRLNLSTPKLIEIHWLPFDEALAQVHDDDTIRDAKTMLELMLADNILSKQAVS